MCKCIDRVNKELEQYNTSLTQVSMLNMKTGKCRQSLTVGTQRRLRMAKPTKVKVVLPTFCPFCGKRAAPAPKVSRTSGIRT